MIKIIANGFGVLSTICFIISFQIKSNKALYFVQAIAIAFYGIQFYLLKATGSLLSMGLQIVRNILLTKIDDWEWLKCKIWVPLFCLPCFVYMIVVWSGWIDILPFIAFAGSTVALWTNNAKKIRILEMATVSPTWLLYDMMTGAYGGILTELVILAAIITSIIRFGWKGLDDPAFKD